MQDFQRVSEKLGNVFECYVRLILPRDLNSSKVGAHECSSLIFVTVNQLTGKTLYLCLAHAVVFFGHLKVS